MLTQYRLTLRPEAGQPVPPETAYRLYAALLESSPSSFGEAAHRDAATPVSQFLVPGPEGTLLWTLNLLGRESEAALSPILETQEHYLLTRRGTLLRVLRREHQGLGGAEELLARASGCSGAHRLRFCTSTAFKSRGQYQNLPTPRLVIQSLLRKWNACLTDCPIEDEDGQGMEALAAGLTVSGFHLESRSYRLKGTVIPGFTGELTLDNRLTGFQRQLTDALLLFSGYSGIGIKTALGMGGVEETPLN